MITVHRFADVTSFLAIGGGFLAEREAEHNLILGLCSRLVTDPRAYAEPPYLAAATEEERVVAIGFRTPPHNLVLSEIDAPAAIVAIARDAQDAFESLPGVLGPTEDARVFTETWRELTGVGVYRTMSNRIYQASAANPPAGVPGLMRCYRDDDRELVIEWLGAFIDEALPRRRLDEPPTAILTRRREDPTEVSFSGKTREHPCARGVRQPDAERDPGGPRVHAASAPGPGVRERTGRPHDQDAAEPGLSVLLPVHRSGQPHVEQHLPARGLRAGFRRG